MFRVRIQFYRFRFVTLLFSSASSIVSFQIDRVFDSPVPVLCLDADLGTALRLNAATR